MSTIDRRARRHEATRAEIRTTARALLVERGPDAVTVNAVARRMGISGPALYRYYASHQALAGALGADIHADLLMHLNTCREAGADASPGATLLRLGHGLRRWALDHPEEFAWTFARPTSTGSSLSPDTAGEDFEAVFRHEFETLWHTSRFPTHAPETLAVGLRAQLEDYVRRSGTSLPVEAAHIFLSSWMRIYGHLCMEVLGQLDFAFTDPGPSYAQCLDELHAQLHPQTESRPR